MDQVILDFGSDKNVLPRKKWERMVRPALQWSAISLHYQNQQKIIPMGHGYGVIMDIHDASTLAEFEVIEIVDYNNPYPALLGIDCSIDMNEVINLKKRKMSFEKKSVKVVVSLKPTKGTRYTEPMHDYVESDDDLDQIYKITSGDENWINPIVDGRIPWDKDSSCTSDLDEELENW